MYHFGILFYAQTFRGTPLAIYDFGISGAPQTIEIMEIIEIGGVGGPTPEPQDLN